MSSSCHAETASSSSSTLLESELSMEPRLEERIKRLLMSYKLSALRNRKPEESDEEELKKFHLQLRSLVNKERNLRRFGCHHL
uniref:LEM domain-containing protein n=1 Tax=Syphacia muris TaxID=451379 RepID=A0A0N5A9P2_9BILA